MRSAVRHIPNVISAARVCATPVLLGLAYWGQLDPFKWLLLAALLSDIMDGLIARAFGLASKLGASLDSTADSLLIVATIYGLWAFFGDLLREHSLAIIFALGLWALEIGWALRRYGRLSSFHTYLVRAGAYAQGTFVVVLFLWGFQPWLFYSTIALIVLGSLEEFVLLWLLPEWEADVRGVYWVLRRRRAAS
jgi:phosphatidylglycerophosphate synthase